MNSWLVGTSMFWFWFESKAQSAFQRFSFEIKRKMKWKKQFEQVKHLSNWKCELNVMLRKKIKTKLKENEWKESLWNSERNIFVGQNQRRRIIILCIFSGDKKEQNE